MTPNFVKLPVVSMSLFFLLPVASAQTRSAEVSNLIAVLRRDDATLHAKARACQQLGEFGTEEAVPALAALLSDEKLSAYARSGLEGIPGPSAVEALRSATGTLKGKLLAGVVNSLGVLRDRNAVAILQKFAAHPGSGVARESLLALGRISNPESIRIVQGALSSGPEPFRPDAAAAALLAAGFQLAAGNDQTAIALYDAVRNANVARSYHTAATRGAIVARRGGALAMVRQTLKSDDRELRNVALLTLRELPPDGIADFLISESESARPDLQAQLIEAMAEFHNARTLGVVRSKASHQNPHIRRAALGVLGKSGEASDAVILLKTVTGSKDPADISVASASLTRLDGAGVDTEITRALAQSTTTESRIALIDVLGRRGTVSASSELIRQAGDAANPEVSLVAFRAMRSLVGLRDVLPLIDVTKTCRDGTRRAAAETALHYASIRNDPGQAGAFVLAELERATEDLDKASWIKTLALLGYDKAVPAIAPMMRDRNSWLAGVAIDNLGKWPDPSPIDSLLNMAETASDTQMRTRALGAAVQVAANAGSARQAPDAAVASWFRRAARAARSAEEKRQLIVGLGKWKHIESFRILAPYVDDSQVTAEVAPAIVSVLEPENRGIDSVAVSFRAQVQPVLEKVAGMGNASLAGRIATLQRAMAGEANER
jgi:HEAT repeat protein